MFNQVYGLGMRILIFQCVIFILLLSVCAVSEAKDIQIIIHLRGVYESNISVLPLSGIGSMKSVAELKNAKDGETTHLTVIGDPLPGEFILRFDYKENKESSPYPSEKQIIINDQDLELWVNPKYSNNPDSTWFQVGERENAAIAKFTKENSKYKEKMGLLRDFLLNYDDTKSKLYKYSIQEYEKRRVAYNAWLIARTKQDCSLFISKLYCFQFIPQINWKGSETDRIYSMINTYFDEIDFNEPLLLKSSQLRKWMDAYVNLYGKLSSTKELRDSLFPEAGRRAVEKAKKGHPLVYGWMVDYFYHGYETNSMVEGMKALEPYINDPNCLTTKKLEIGRRLKGMETLAPGSKAPDILLNDWEGQLFDLTGYQVPEPYILLLFWSAGCSHCIETVNELYPWQQQIEVQHIIQVVDISLDDTDADIQKWEQKITTLKGWKHIHTKEGVNSKAASDYFVLSTPQMILIDSRTKDIIKVPNSFEDLKVFFNTR
jgi:thioredoxin-related protein